MFIHECMQCEWYAGRTRSLRSILDLQHWHKWSMLGRVPWLSKPSWSCWVCTTTWEHMWGRRLDLLQLRWKGKRMDEEGWGWVTQEDYRDAICYCREIGLAKAQLELTSNVEGNKNACYTHSKLRSRDNTGLFPVGRGSPHRQGYSSSSGI